MKSYQNSGSAASHYGFSLIEVALAIGIVSFALVSLLGSLPVGLMSAQEAVLQTTRTHVLQQISADLGTLPSSESLETYLGTIQYYNYSGERIPSNVDAYYRVVLSKEKPSYPGADSLSGLGGRFQRIIVKMRQASVSDGPVSSFFLPSFALPEAQ